MLNMPKRLCLVLIVLIAVRLEIRGQETGYGPGYQLSMIGNPAVTGSEGDGYLRLSYMNLYPGYAYNLHSAFISYDGYFPGLHGGAGIYFSDDFFGGIVNDLRGGLSYAYFFRAGKDLYFSSGLSASFYHRGYSFDGAVLPDQIDPLGGVVFPAGEILAAEGRTIFDLGTGFVFYTGRISGGIAVNHLAEPDLSASDLAEGKLKRRLFMHFTGDFPFGRGGKFNVHPLGIIEMQKDQFSGAGGAVLETKYLSVSSLLFADNGRNIDLQEGFSVNTSLVNVFYNYRFNLVSGQDLLPFSLLHHTGIVLRLNNVDKRKTIKTINFPKL
jgi:type IX secretion system PorP/SprF family membrane protein